MKDLLRLLSKLPIELSSWARFTKMWRTATSTSPMHEGRPRRSTSYIRPNKRSSWISGRPSHRWPLPTAIRKLMKQCRQTVIEVWWCRLRHRRSLRGKVNPWGPRKSLILSNWSPSSSQFSCSSLSSSMGQEPLLTRRAPRDSSSAEISALATPRPAKVE